MYFGVYSAGWFSWYVFILKRDAFNALFCCEFISENIWLMCEKKVLMIAKVSSTYCAPNCGLCCEVICASCHCRMTSAMGLEIDFP